MHIASIRHKGLRQLYEDDNGKGVQASSVDKLKKLLFAIETATSLDDLAVAGMAASPTQGRLGRVLEPDGDRKLEDDFSV